MEVPIRNEARMTKKAAEKKVVYPKSLADLQKLKVDKLMRNPDKPVFIPQQKKEWKPRDAPEFVRDVMGSSAGAGSGEFHVYRHIRRREFAREQYMDSKGKKQRLDDEFEKKRLENVNKANDATSKKRAKRLRKKQKMLLKKKQQKKQEDGDKKEEPSSESEAEGEENAREDDAEEQSFVMGGR